jgi:translation elongation factor EF-Tu-like GTPase
MASEKHVIVGTAGHIDHGKSALVEALTGTNPDRLEEEKRRGITIDLGFAFLRMEDVRFGFVDVPGHERFVRNMLAGAGGIDVLLLAACLAFRGASWRSQSPISLNLKCSTWCGSKLKNLYAARFSRMRRSFR